LTALRVILLCGAHGSTRLGSLLCSNLPGFVAFRNSDMLMIGGSRRLAVSIAAANGSNAKKNTSNQYNARIPEMHLLLFPAWFKPAISRLEPIAWTSHESTDLLL